MVGQVTQVSRHAECAEYHEHGAAQQHCKPHQDEVDQAIGGLAPFTVAVHQAQAAPERQQARQIAPEGIVLVGAAIDP
ncbi:hypothetical protein D9M71_274910 [compost metagenome]